MITRRKLLAAAMISAAIAVPSVAAAAELLMFEEPGCVWCARWRAEVGPAYAKSAEGKRAPLRSIPISSSGTLAITLDKPVVASPTFVLADNGREIGRIVGYPGADFFWGLLDRLMTRLDRSQAL